MIVDGGRDTATTHQGPATGHLRGGHLCRSHYPTTDPITMLLVTGPFIVLYEFGIVLARMAAKQRARRAAEAEKAAEAEIASD